MSTQLHAPDNGRGIVLMVVSQALFTVNDTLTKTCAAELPAGQIMAVRGAFAVLLLLPVALRAGAFRNFRRSYARPVMARNICESVSIVLYLPALLVLPLANVISIMQTGPMMMMAAGALLLGHHVGWRRWLAAGVGLVGVLLIVKPGTADFSWWYVAAFLGVVVGAGRDLVTRTIARETPTILLSFLTAVAVMLSGCALGLTETWRVPSATATALLASAAVLLVIGYNAMINAWRIGEVAVVGPFRYVSVLFALVLGYAVFRQVPDAVALAGSGLVIATGLYSLFREQQVRRQTGP